jgi:hypothetical protein
MLFPRKFWREGNVVVLVIAMMMAFLGIGYSLPASSLSRALVSGQISESTTWTLTNSPYVIIADVVVGSGVNLTIDAGVAVRFDGNFSVTVKGTLQAVGTANNPIVFTSNRAEPNSGDWNTIEFNGTTNEFFVMKHCAVKYARNGVTVQSLGRATIENSEIVNNSLSGVYVLGRSNLALKENAIEFNGNGISSGGEKVSGITIVSNSIRFNENGTHFQAMASQGASISNVTISRNTVSLNRNGLYFYIFAGSGLILDTSIIRDISISENVVSSNAKYGIYLYSGGPWLGSIYSTSIFENRILSNEVGVYLFANTHYQDTNFDVTISENTVTGNWNKGLHVFGGPPRPRPSEPGIKTNITRNSISYNNHGVFYEGDTNNVASNNDVYNNTYGMNVANEATVNAEYNYWGDVNGPYHPSINPAGKGNSVNGNGVDLDFVPFLFSPAVNEHPVARLEADKTLLGVREEVTFNASTSSDDGYITSYFFDFGDGANSGWTAEPVETHAYASNGSYIASLTVMDDLGFESENIATLVINVQLTLIVEIDFIDTVCSNENLDINVKVTDGLMPVPEAYITLYASNHESVFSQNGRTNSTGGFSTTLTVPAVTEKTVVLVIVNATKEGYLSGQGQRLITIMPKPPSLWLDFILPVLAVTVVSIALAITLIVGFRVRRKKSKVVSVSETI